MVVHKQKVLKTKDKWSMIWKCLVFPIFLRNYEIIKILLQNDFLYQANNWIRRPPFGKSGV